MNILALSSSRKRAVTAAAALLSTTALVALEGACSGDAGGPTGGGGPSAAGNGGASGAGASNGDGAGASGNGAGAAGSGAAGGSGGAGNGGGAAGGSGGSGASGGVGTGGAGGSAGSGSTGGSGGAAGSGGSGAAGGSGGSGASGGVGAGGAGGSGSGGSGSGGAGGAPNSGHKRVFVTSAAYPANLKVTGNGTDGLAGADALCTQSANAQKLGGTWKAWISSKTVSAIDRIVDVGPWYRLDGKEAFTNKTNLTTTPGSFPVTIDERGSSTTGLVWTGTNTGGRTSSLTCFEWTVVASADKGTTGLLFSSAQWTQTTNTPNCATKAHLYCFEQ